MRNYKRLFLIFFALIFFQRNGFSTEVEGIVKAQNGQPISKADIFPYGSLESIITTNEEGKFSFTTSSKIILIRCEGYEPQTKILDEVKIKLEITLQRINQKRVELPSCSSVQVKGTRVGSAITFTALVYAEIHHSSDSDYSAFDISFGSEKDRVWLTGIWGPHATSGFPDKELILNSSEFTQHSLANWFIDSKGKLKDGTYWRYIGRFGTAYYYRGVTEQAAKYFDAILDTACR